MANVQDVKATLHIGAAEIVTRSCVRTVKRVTQIQNTHACAPESTQVRQDHAFIVIGIELTGSVQIAIFIYVSAVQGSGQDAFVRTGNGAIQWRFQ